MDEFSTSTQPEVVFDVPTLDLLTPARFIYAHTVGGDWNAFLASAEFWWNVYSIIALIFSAICFIGFVYARLRFEQLYEIEQERLREGEKKWAERHTRVRTTNDRWASIEARVEENTPESWRIAIIEADIMLDDMLTKAGYSGKSLGEKLKSANPQSFTTIQDAWEAHKVRNEIAHVGSDFILTQKTAKETIMRFERVFREFGAI